MEGRMKTKRNYPIEYNHTGFIPSMDLANDTTKEQNNIRVIV